MKFRYILRICIDFVTLMKGRLYHGYIDLDVEGQKELSYWIKLALAYNQELTQHDKK